MSTMARRPCSCAHSAMLGPVHCALSSSCRHPFAAAVAAGASHDIPEQPQHAFHKRCSMHAALLGIPRLKPRLKHIRNPRLAHTLHHIRAKTRHAHLQDSWPMKMSNRIISRSGGRTHRRGAGTSGGGLGVLLMRERAQGPGGLGGRLVGPHQQHCEVEHRALAHGRLHPCGAAHELRQPLGDDQPQPCSKHTPQPVSNS